MEDALKFATERIERFHRACIPSSVKLVEDGVQLEWRAKAVERVGIYVPGGKAPYPSTLLMNAIPARVAGVKEIVVATPGKSVHEAILYAAKLCGVKKIFRMGGAHAISALAYGTETIEKVDVITGPGNIFVALAKREVMGDVGIDMIAGPSEVLVMTDGSVSPSLIAWELIAQAEHDEMAIPLLLATSDVFVNMVLTELKRNLRTTGRRTIAGQAINRNGLAIICRNLEEMIEIVNLFAPEHLQIAMKKPEKIIGRIRNAGAIFLNTPVALGDYTAGPNHTLPTGGRARFSSPLSGANFIKWSSIISVKKKGLRKLGDMTIRLAECEGLEAHASSIKVRMEG